MYVNNGIDRKVIILSGKLYFFVFLSTDSILFYPFALIKRKEQKQDAFAFVLLRMKSHQNLWTRWVQCIFLCREISNPLLYTRRFLIWVNKVRMHMPSPNPILQQKLKQLLNSIQKTLFRLLRILIYISRDLQILYYVHSHES